MADTVPAAVSEKVAEVKEAVAPSAEPVPETPQAAKEADAEAKVEEAETKVDEAEEKVAAAAEEAKDEPGLKDKLMKAKALAEEQLQEAKGTVDKIKGLFGK